MSTDHGAYLRIKAQALLLADIVDLLLATLSPESRAVVAVGRAIRLIRRGLDVVETAATTHVELMSGLQEVEGMIRLMKAEARSPTHVEWEALRSRIESAAQRIGEI